MVRTLARILLHHRRRFGSIQTRGMKYQSSGLSEISVYKGVQTMKMKTDVKAGGGLINIEDCAVNVLSVCFNGGKKH
jgi:hypothetical protein